MSRELDCAIRTAAAAIENVIQICKEEREEADIYIDGQHHLDQHIMLYNGCITIMGNSWVSSSYEC